MVDSRSRIPDRYIAVVGLARDRTHRPKETRAERLFHRFVAGLEEFGFRVIAIGRQYLAVDRSSRFRGAMFRSATDVTLVGNPARDARLTSRAQIALDDRAHRGDRIEPLIPERTEVELERFGFDDGRRVRGDPQARDRDLRFAACVEPGQLVSRPIVDAREGKAPAPVRPSRCAAPSVTEFRNTARDRVALGIRRRPPQRRLIEGRHRVGFSGARQGLRRTGPVRASSGKARARSARVNPAATRRECRTGRRICGATKSHSVLPLHADTPNALQRWLIRLVSA